MRLIGSILASPASFLHYISDRCKSAVGISARIIRIRAESSSRIFFRHSRRAARTSRSICIRDMCISRLPPPSPPPSYLPVECNTFNYFVTEQFVYVNTKINLARSGILRSPASRETAAKLARYTSPDRINRLGKDVTPKPLFLRENAKSICQRQCNRTKPLCHYLLSLLYQRPPCRRLLHERAPTYNAIKCNSLFPDTRFVLPLSFFKSAAPLYIISVAIYLLYPLSFALFLTLHLHSSLLQFIIIYLHYLST